MKAKRHTLADALRVAADQYDSDALEHSKLPAGEGLMTAEGRARIVECFTLQAADARRLAGEIEQSAIVQLED